MKIRERDMLHSRRGLIGAGAALTLAGTAGAKAKAAAPEAKFVFTLPVTTVPVVDTDEVFPVRRIYCIGRNYPEHSREMGSDPTREPPFFFQKPADAVEFVQPGTVGDHAYPSLTHNYHHEIELVAFLKSGGANIPIDQALSHVYGYTVGLDMTRRDLQREMGNEKKPWEIGKSFDHAAPMGPIHRADKIGHPTKGAISLAINGKVRQQADLSDMIWSVAEQISKLSEAFELKAGDMVYSGTPANVGPVVKGDVLVGKIDGFPDLSIRIV